MSKLVPAVVLSAAFLGGCIATDNAVIQAGDGTSDVTECAILDGLLVRDETYIPNAAALNSSDSRVHPDVFYLGWAQLDTRNDLRFPTRGYSGDGFEDSEIARTRRWLITRAASIWGGTSEIQRNIIAKRVLMIPE